MSHREGSLLVVTLWLIAVSAAIAVALGGYLAMETRLRRYALARAHAKAFAMAGIHFAIQRLAQDAAKADEPYDWLGDDWAIASTAEAGTDPTQWVVRLPSESVADAVEGRVTIQMRDEERRLDLNSAPEAAVTQLLGVPAVAKAIVDYRDADDEGADLSVQPPYMPKNAPATTMEELWDIPSVAAQPGTQDLLRAYGTVWTNGALNINTVSREVLMAMGATATLADRLVTSRPGPDGRLGTVDDCLATDKSQAAHQLAACAGVDAAGEDSLVTLLTGASWDVHSSVFHITAIGTRDATPVTWYRIDAVVRRGITAATTQILAWKEE